jgi:hypothetical protein
MWRLAGDRELSYRVDAVLREALMTDPFEHEWPRHRRTRELIPLLQPTLDDSSYRAGRGDVAGPPRWAGIAQAADPNPGAITLTTGIDFPSVLFLSGHPPGDRAEGYVAALWRCWHCAVLWRWSMEECRREFRRAE